MPIEAVTSGVGGVRPIGAPSRSDFGEVLRAGCEKPPGLSAAATEATRWADRLVDAQRCLDGVLHRIEKPGALSPGGLLRLQVQAYQATQELELAGKLVEKSVSGVKHVLQTQV